MSCLGPSRARSYATRGITTSLLPQRRAAGGLNDVAPLAATRRSHGGSPDEQRDNLGKVAGPMLTVYDACGQMLRFNCLLPGWKEDARVPFLFTGVTWWRTDAIERKVAEAWTDDGRAPLATTDLDPEHHLSALERRYADRVTGMFVRADSRASFERDIAAIVERCSRTRPSALMTPAAYERSTEL